MSKFVSALAFAAMIALSGTALAAEQTFDDLDTNDDGVLSRAEASSAEGIDFSSADTNKDGSLDRSEYEAATA